MRTDLLWVELQLKYARQWAKAWRRSAHMHRFHAIQNRRLLESSRDEIDQILNAAQVMRKMLEADRDRLTALHEGAERHIGDLLTVQAQLVEAIGDFWSGYCAGFVPDATVDKLNAALAAARESQK